MMTNYVQYIEALQLGSFGERHKSHLYILFTIYVLNKYLPR